VDFPMLKEKRNNEMAAEKGRVILGVEPDIMH
jgi:hypothetical protein